MQLVPLSTDGRVTAVGSTLPVPGPLAGRARTRQRRRPRRRPRSGDAATGRAARWARRGGVRTGAPRLAEEGLVEPARRRSRPATRWSWTSRPRPTACSATSFHRAAPAWRRSLLGHASARRSRAAGGRADRHRDPRGAPPGRPRRPSPGGWPSRCSPPPSPRGSSGAAHAGGHARRAARGRADPADGGALPAAGRRGRRSRAAAPAARRCCGRTTAGRRWSCGCRPSARPPLRHPIRPSWRRQPDAVMPPGARAGPRWSPRPGFRPRRTAGRGACSGWSERSWASWCWPRRSATPATTAGRPRPRPFRRRSPPRRRRPRPDSTADPIPTSEAVDEPVVAAARRPGSRRRRRGPPRHGPPRHHDTTHDHPPHPHSDDQRARAGPGGAREATGRGETTSSGCDPNYSGCVLIASDVDCEGGSGNGPAVRRGPVRVIGDDIYGLDRGRRVGRGIGRATVATGVAWTPTSSWWAPGSPASSPPPSWPRPAAGSWSSSRSPRRPSAARRTGRSAGCSSSTPPSSGAPASATRLDLALQDWLGSAGFDRDVDDRREDFWARQLGERLRASSPPGRSAPGCTGSGVRFFPVVGWAERGGHARRRARQLGAPVPRRVGHRHRRCVEPFVRQVRAAPSTDGLRRAAASGTGSTR